LLNTNIIIIHAEKKTDAPVSPSKGFLYAPSEKYVRALGRTLGVHCIHM